MTVSSMMTNDMPNDKELRSRILRGGQQRDLGDVQEFEIDLYVDLQYVNEVVASELETMDPSNANILHFCNSCILQVRRQWNEKTRKCTESTSHTFLFVTVSFLAPL
jgi:hypothetical protein